MEDSKITKERSFQETGKTTGEHGFMEDSRIIDLYWERSEQAIRETDAKYGGKLLRLTNNVTGSRRDAEECTNDTYHAAWNSMPPARPDSLFAWLAKTARRFALRKIEYNTAKKRNSQLTVILDELEELAGSGPSEEERRCDSEEILEVISSFLRQLPEERRKIFVRRYWYADSLSDIAQQFSISESKAKSLLFRLRKQLKKMLEAEGITL